MPPIERSEVPRQFRNPASGASNAQLNLLDSLMREREIDADAASKLKARIAAQKEANERGGDRTLCEDGITIKRAGEFIVRLKDKPKLRSIPKGVPTGRYAVEAANGELRFYRVWRGTRNPNYVKLYVEHGPEESEIPFPAMPAILRKIEADPFTAAIRYGREIGACCICGKRLTNALSRELGIGPVCGGRFFDDTAKWSLMKAEARQTIIERGDDPDAEVDWDGDWWHR